MDHEVGKRKSFTIMQSISSLSLQSIIWREIAMPFIITNSSTFFFFVGPQ